MVMKFVRFTTFRNGYETWINPASVISVMAVPASKHPRDNSVRPAHTAIVCGGPGGSFMGETQPITHRVETPAAAVVAQLEKELS
jgi:hypothetical protein